MAEAGMSTGEIVEWEERAAERLLAAGYEQRRRLYAEIYDADNAFWLKRHGRTGVSGQSAKNHTLLRAACPGSGPVLDIGGGTGIAGEAFPSSRMYVVCDASLRVGLEPGGDPRRERLRVLGFATELPFADGTFEAVLALDVLEHLHREDIDRCLDEAHRVLRPRGRLLMATPNRLSGPWDSRCEVPDGFRRKGLHLNEMTAGEMLRLARRHGFHPLAFAVNNDGISDARFVGLQAGLREAWAALAPRRFRRRFWKLAVVLAERR